MSRGAARRTLLAHFLTTISVTVLVFSGMLIVDWMLTTRQAEDIAVRVSSRLAQSLQETLRKMDFGDDIVLDGERARELDDRMQGFFESGTVERVKLWRVEGDEVRVVYSDEPSVIGDVRTFSPDLAKRLDAGETVVLPVPNDYEHRFESGLPVELREAFIGFVDARGHHMRLEVYIPVHAQEAIADRLRVQIPVAIGGLIILVSVLLPLSLHLARRMRSLAAEQEQADAFALQAREAERVDLARRLHDDVIQSLSGARLALGAVEGQGERGTAMIGRVVDVLGESTKTLREMTSGFIPPIVTGANLEERLGELVAGAGTSVSYRGSHDEAERDRVVALGEHEASVLYATTREALRNAMQHASATRIEVALSADVAGVSLSVTDDGVGLRSEDRARARETGHVGLELLERAARRIGGELTITRTSDGGTVLRVSIPAPVHRGKPTVRPG